MQNILLLCRIIVLLICRFTQISNHLPLLLRQSSHPPSNICFSCSMIVPQSCSIPLASIMASSYNPVSLCPQIQYQPIYLSLVIRLLIASYHQLEASLFYLKSHQIIQEVYSLMGRQKEREMQGNQENFLCPISEKLWEHECFYIDLFFPMDLNYSHADTSSKNKFFSNKR